MNTKETLSLTYRYKFFHLFPSSGKYKKVKDTLEIKSGTLSDFLLAIRRKEGKGGLFLANIVLSLLTLIIAILMDFYIPRLEIYDWEFIVIALVYTFVLSLKFGFIKLNNFRNIGEMFFSLLSLFFTRYFTLTLLLILIFENAEALSSLEA